MCAPTTASLAALTLTAVLACLFPDVEGLPLAKQEPDTAEDLLAGRDFLQVLLELPTTKPNKRARATSPTSLDLENFPNFAREVRSTKPSTNSKLVDVKISSKESRVYLKKGTKGRAIGMSSSTTMRTTTSVEKEEKENSLVLEEERESIVAEANRHEFNVEEMEPITRDAEPGYTEELPANVQAIPVIKKLSDFEKTSELLKELSQEKLKDKLQPFHHTVIYHDNEEKMNKESSIPRSVSYSAVVQNIQNDRWKTANPTQPENPKIPIVYGQPEQNYEVDEAVSVQTNGRTHGIQTQSNEKPTSPTKSKNGYVIEGRKERRYRVEERTPDGFIVGEFGIVNHDDGLLRGVRYTADETINPKLIYDTLMKFLSL